mgnify:CR=1 FL=1
MIAFLINLIDRFSFSGKLISDHYASEWEHFFLQNPRDHHDSLSLESFRFHEGKVLCWYRLPEFFALTYTILQVVYIFIIAPAHVQRKREVQMSRSKEMDLTTGNPFWSLLKFAIPVILGNLFQLFYTLADSVIVGKTLGADSLAAVGSTSIIIYFVFCLSMDLPVDLVSAWGSVVVQRMKKDAKKHCCFHSFKYCLYGGSYTCLLSACASDT